MPRLSKLQTALIETLTDIADHRQPRGATFGHSIRTSKSLAARGIVTVTCGRGPWQCMDQLTSNIRERNDRVEAAAATLPAGNLVALAWLAEADRVMAFIAD